MLEIIPAIMPKKINDLESHVGLVKDHVATVQLDLMDGDFVSGVTWPYFSSAPDGVPNDDYFQAIQNEEAGLPNWEEVDYELDLMVRHPDKHIDQWVRMGPRRIIFHLESLHDPAKALQELQSIREIIEIGLSFNNDFDVSELARYVELIDCVQVMGIAEIGKQGEPFDERALDLIKTIIKQYPDLPISVDGSVNTNTIQQFADAGATRFVMGSAIFGSGVVKENIEQLRKMS